MEHFVDCPITITCGVDEQAVLKIRGNYIGQQLVKIRAGAIVKSCG
jgi:hypothetical protein